MTKDLFRTRDHVANFDAMVEEYKMRSAITRASLKMIADVAYGEGPGEKLDIFLPSAAAAQFQCTCSSTVATGACSPRMTSPLSLIR